MRLTSRLRCSGRKWEVIIFRDKHTLHHNIYHHHHHYLIFQYAHHQLQYPPIEPHQVQIHNEMHGQILFFQPLFLKFIRKHIFQILLTPTGPLQSNSLPYSNFTTNSHISHSITKIHFRSMSNSNPLYCLQSTLAEHNV